MPGSDRIAKMRGVLPAAVVSALLTLTILGGRIDRPVDRGIAGSLFSYQTLFFRNWDEAGFFRLRGIPCVGAGGETVAERSPYLHHPVLSYWCMYASRTLLGWSERAFRVPSVIASVAAAFLAAVLAGRRFGGLSALLAGAAFAVLPLTFNYGDLPNPEPFVVCFLLLGFLLFERLCEKRTCGRRLLFLLAFLVGCLFDWQVYFLFPALLLREMLRPAGRRNLSEVLRLLPVGIGAFALTLGHFMLAAGSLEALWHHVGRTALVTVGGPKDRGLEAWIGHQLLVFGRDLGWPVVALLALLLVGAAAKPRLLRTPEGSTALALFVPLVLNLAVFRVPAFDHAFYWMPALVGIPFLLALFERRFRSSRPLLATGAVVAVIAGSVVLDFRNEVDRDSSKDPTEDHRVLAQLIDRFAGPGELVLTPESLGAAMFYAKARFYDTIDTPEKLAEVLSRPSPATAAWVFLFEKNKDRFAALVEHCEAHGESAWHPEILSWKFTR